jgi:type IV pilus assembly protein PilY1
MNTRQRYWRKAMAYAVMYSLVLGQTVQSVQAASTDISDVPMAVKNSVKPNVAVIIDNSESMDALMSGKLIAGDDPATRGNTGRQVMRDTITAYRTAFSWGLMSYGMTSNPTRYNTYAYYLGSDTGMVFTDDCVNGLSATNGGRRCVANPQPFTGGNFVTYDQSGDDANIQDVLYTGGVFTSLWGLSSAGTSYDIYLSHNAGSGNSWASSAFSSSQGNWSFTPTDAGFLPNNPPITRQLYLPRAWGYNSDITGSGTINVPVQADSTSQYNNLIAKLAAETSSNTSEIKNGAVFTPLKGTLDSARTYFSSSFQDNTSPIAYSCQKNFVMLVTDGLPTGDTSGNLYSTAARTNTQASPPNGPWTFGQAAQDAINSVTALRSTVKGSTTYNIETYVVALGDTVANANAVAVMNAMAAAGGTDSAYLANDATSFQSAINSVASNIVDKTGSAAAVVVSNANVIAGDNASYASTYNSGTWTGNLLAYPVNLTTGQPDTAAPIWTGGSAQTQLDARTAAGRKIATYTGTTGTGHGIQFQPTTATTTTKLSTDQQTLLNSSTTPPGTSDGAAVVAYLRGDRSGETAGTYRARSHLLGDIINAEPVVVRQPAANYGDTGYSDFKTANASRTRIVLQGANDGMLHAFNTATGAEEWAYVPNLLMASLNNLSRKAGFVHKFLVDGTPFSNDVDFSNTDGVTGNPAASWRTILVGGLGKGGRGYYALNVTSTTATDEATVAGKVLWEFPNSATDATVKANIGYSFGRPIIVKTKAKGWVVLVTSGYNNGTNTGDSGGNGQGYLFVLNARTGDLITAIGTGVGSATDPSGLAYISAYVDAGDIDDTVEYVYGGDLTGNVWRFDLTANNTNQWGVTKLATLVDSLGNSQPVTTEPELAKVNIGGGVFKRFVYVGTGLYLGDTDISGAAGANAHASQTQTMYGVVDDLSTPSGSTPVITPLRTSLQPQTFTVNGDSSRTASATPLDFSTAKGWYIDLPSTGERINTHPALALGALVFTSNVPSTDVCLPGGSSFFNVLDYKTGGYLTGSTVSWSSVVLGNTLASRVVVIKLPSGAVIGLARKSDASTVTVQVPLPSSSFATKRKSWIELMQ